MPRIAPSPSEKPKKKFYTKWWFWIIVVVVVISVATSGGNDKKGKDDSYSVSPASTSADQQKAPAVAEIAVDIELGSGHYTAGIDFPPGRYNIEALAGGGNVISSNSFSGGINAIIGVEDKNADVGLDMYEQSYSNISLDKDVVLSISGVTVRLTCDKASGEELAPRNQSITKSVTLKNGHFVAGEDFPPGVYDISAISGGGNVISDNIYSGGINAILGIESKNKDLGIDMYEQKYLNIELREDVTLSIDGVEVLLEPSK